MSEQAPQVAGMLSLKDPVMAPNGAAYYGFFHDDWMVDNPTDTFLAVTRKPDGTYDPFVTIGADNVHAFFSGKDICDYLRDDEHSPVYFLDGV